MNGFQCQFFRRFFTTSLPTKTQHVGNYASQKECIWQCERKDFSKGSKAKSLSFCCWGSGSFLIFGKYQNEEPQHVFHLFRFLFLRFLLNAFWWFFLGSRGKKSPGKQHTQTHTTANVMFFKRSSSCFLLFGWKDLFIICVMLAIEPDLLATSRVHRKVLLNFFGWF